jgi:hypothetical protein
MLFKKLIVLKLLLYTDLHWESHAIVDKFNK